MQGFFDQALDGIVIIVGYISIIIVGLITCILIIAAVRAINLALGLNAWGFSRGGSDDSELEKGYEDYSEKRERREYYKNRYEHGGRDDF